MNSHVNSLLIFLAAVLLPAQAFAYTDIYGYNDNGHLYVGMVDHDGTKKAWLCDDGPGGGDATWTSLGTTSGLTGDYQIHGDASTEGTGHDILEVLRSDRTITGDCAARAGVWSALAYNAHWCDLWGDGGNDWIGTGSGDTIGVGYTGADTLYNYGTQYVDGGSGNDYVFGWAGSSDDLRGSVGDDCLQDGNNTWSNYNCGDGSDQYYTGDTGAKTSCESSTASCL